MSTSRCGARYVSTAIALAIMLGYGPASATLHLTRFAIPTPNSFPFGITAGPDGNVWFTEAPVLRIARITPAGAITEFPVPADAPLAVVRGIATGPDGNLWFTLAPDQIGRVTPAGAITRFTISPTPEVPNPEPWSITSGPDGNLWFTVIGGIGRITQLGAITLFPAPLVFRGDITVGPDGNVWFTEFPDRIARITPGGAIEHFPLALGGFIRAGDIAFGPDENLWFTEPAGRRVGRMTPTGVATAFDLPLEVSAQHLVADPDGTLWFTSKWGVSTAMPAVSSLSQAGSPTGVFVPLPPNPLAGTFPVGLPSGPSAITRGPDGSLWLLLPDTNEVARLAEGPPFVTVSPGSGEYLTTQRFDVTLVVDTAGVPATGGSATLDGVDVSVALPSCGVPGTLAGGVLTLRCPGLTGAALGPGLHVLTVTIDLADGSKVTDIVTWSVVANTEP